MILSYIHFFTIYYTMKKSYLSCILIILFMIAATNSDILFTGTSTGLQLWLFTVVPTLFPFILLSNYMILYNSTDYASLLISPITKPLLGISKSANYAIITGLLCGYPMGAKACADLVKEGKINIKEGNYLLTFVNNASPAFISSYILTTLLMHKLSLTALAILIYAPCLITALIFRPYFKYRFKEQIFENNYIHSSTRHSIAVFQNTCRTLMQVGIYILVFSILCEFFKLLPYEPIKIFLTGISEITTGTFIISINNHISDIQKIRLIILFTSTGGLSALFQISSMLKGSGLSIIYYIYGKICCGLLSLLLSFIIL